jgi:hypothetical protein
VRGERALAAKARAWSTKSALTSASPPTWIRSSSSDML